MKFLNIIFIILTLSLTSLFAQQETEVKQALLIIDMQEFYFPQGFNPLVEPEEASQQAAKLLDHFRSTNKLVVHIKHASKKDSLIHQNVRPGKEEKVITKYNVNSYQETDLLDYLKQNKIEQLVICGMMTHMCVEAAARASADYGFKVIIIDDACATRDMIYNNDTVKAADVHNTTLGTLNRYYGKVLTTEEFLNN